MKKLLKLALAILLLVPLSASANFAAPWFATSTNPGFVQVNAINGNTFPILVPFINTISGTSTFGGGINLTSGCFAIAGVCQTGGGSSITLTTTGSSGAATLIGNVLNIPIYTGGSGTNFFTNSGNNTFLNTGSLLQFPYLEATSTTASSTIDGTLQVGSTTQSGSALGITSSISPFPSYGQPQSIGNRSASITVSTNISLGTGSIGRLVNGDYSAHTLFWNNQTVTSSLFLEFDFGSALVLNQAKYYQQTTDAQGTWQWQASNNNSTWTSIGSSFALGGIATQAITTLSANTTAYRYYRILGVSGTMNNTPWVYQFDFGVGLPTSILQSYGTGNTLQLNPSGGFVGIGTTTPSSNFSVTGTTTLSIPLQITSGGTSANNSLNAAQNVGTFTFPSNGSAYGALGDYASVTPSFNGQIGVDNNGSFGSNFIFGANGTSQGNWQWQWEFPFGFSQSGALPSQLPPVSYAPSAFNYFFQDETTGNTAGVSAIQDSGILAFNFSSEPNQSGTSIGDAVMGTNSIGNAIIQYSTGATFTCVSENRNSNLAPGNCYNVFNRDSTSNKGYAINGPSLCQISGDTGNDPLLYAGFLDDAVHFIKCGQGEYQPTDTGIVQSVSITSGGTGYSVGDTLRLVEFATTTASVSVTSVSGGVITGIQLTGAEGYGRGYTASSSVATLTGGINTDVPPVLTSGGTGYTQGDEVTVVQSGASGGKFHVAYVDGNGKILNLNPEVNFEVGGLNNIGVGYHTATGLSLSGGTGSGATVNITGDSTVGTGTGAKIAINSVGNATDYATFNNKTGLVSFPSLATPAGTFLAVDSKGILIATTTPSGGGGSGITALTGDVTASGSGSVAATLATVNSNVGSFTNANVTVNAKGLITAVSNGTGGGASFDWQQENNTFGVKSLTPTTTIPLEIKSTSSSTFAGGLSSFALVSAPYFVATSTSGISTFNGNIHLGPTSSPVTGSERLIVADSTGSDSDIGLVNPASGSGAVSSLSFESSGGILTAPTPNVFLNGYTSFGQTAFYSYLRNQWTDGEQISGDNFGLDFFVNPTGVVSLINGSIGTQPAMTIASSTGNVGIGTTTPYAKLSVAGTVVGQNFMATSTATSTFNGPIQSTCFTTDNITCLNNTYANASAYKQASKYATTAALPANTYVNGTGGVGATLTEVGTGALSVDGASPSIGDRILVKNEVTGANNGIYTVTATGSGIAAYVLTRATDFNSSADVFPGVATYISAGTANIDDVWALSNTSAVTIGTTALTFAEITSTPLITSVSNSDSTLTISPTTGAVVGSLNLSHANNWLSQQNFAVYTGIGTTSPDFRLTVSSGAILNPDFVPATSTSMTISFATSTSQTIKIGTAATTVTLRDAKPGAVLRLSVFNPPSLSAGALTFTASGANIHWVGSGSANTVPTQTTTAGAYDTWTFTVFTGTSTTPLIEAAQLPY